MRLVTCCVHPTILTPPRWDSIAINGKPVSEADFRKVEKHFMELNIRENINASEFELLTATAFQLFNDKNVEVGVVEVGLGGSLDATNILNNQAVSVITKISHDHQNFLGNTLESIARHKAGILRPNVPYIVNPHNEFNIHHVINAYAKEIGAGPRIDVDSEELRNTLYNGKRWEKFASRICSCERDNAVLGYLAFVEVLKSLDLDTAKTFRFLDTVRDRKFPGRFQKHSVLPVFGTTSKRQIVVDGAHNPDAARALHEFVDRSRLQTTREKKERNDTNNEPVTWVLAMTEGKDARGYLRELLSPGDNVITTAFGPVDGMPWVKPMDPEELLTTVIEVEPAVSGLAMLKKGAFRALCAAKYLSSHDNPIVLTGSLYLVGDFMREKAQWQEGKNTLTVESADKEERHRVNQYLTAVVNPDAHRSSNNLKSPSNGDESCQMLRSELLQDAIERLEREIQSVDTEEQRIERAPVLRSDNLMFGGTPSLPATPLPESDSRKASTAFPEPFFDEVKEIGNHLEQLSSRPSSATPVTGIEADSSRDATSQEPKHPMPARSMEKK